MIKKPINQNHSFDLELLNSIGYNYIFNNEPINFQLCNNTFEVLKTIPVTSSEENN